MNNILLIILLAIIGGLIGWITNILAIKLMFRPIEPIRIPLINYEIIGLIPKRKKEIAENIGEVIAKELISIDDIINRSITEEDKIYLSKIVKEKIKNVISNKTDFIPGPFKMMIQGSIENVIEQEVDNVLNEVGEEAISYIKNKVDIKGIVEEKINELDLISLERIIISVAKKELKHIETLGFILGAVIGCIQGIVVMLIK